MVIIINADEDEEDSADQEEHGTCSYPATLDQGDSGNWRRRETRQRLVMKKNKWRQVAQSCFLLPSNAEAFSTGTVNPWLRLFTSLISQP